ncbi:MAG: ABC transporter permease, partial [Pseudomonadota bacterium]
MSTPATNMTGRPGTSAAEQSLPLSAEEAKAFRRSRKRGQRRALFLVTPVIAFLLFAFIAPIASMLVRSAYDPGVADAIPGTLQALAAWDGRDVPDSAVQTILAHDLRRLALTRESGSLGADINRAYPGASSAVNSAARRLRRLDDEAIAATGAKVIMQSNPRWQDPALWRAIAQSGSAYTTRYYLTALDLERTSDGEIQARESARIYIPLYLKTLKLALIITLLCLVLGYPLVYYLANAKSKQASWLFILVLLPFWTSLLVRTTAWIAILQTNGVMNSTLTTLGLISVPLNVLYTEMATIIAMTHILLPFMILP